MSTLKVNNLQDINGANNSTPSEVANGRAKAFANVETGTSTSTGQQKTINSSYNISSVVDIDTGTNQVNFTTAFANNNYVVLATAGHNDVNNNNNSVCEVREVTTTGFKVITEDVDGPFTDRDKLFIVIFSA